MAEYTIPKPYRDFYVTDPYVGLQKEVEDLQRYSNPFSSLERGFIIHGENTLPDKVIPVKVESSNLIPFPYTDTDKTLHGVTFSVSSDRGVTVSGTPDGMANFGFCTIYPDISETYTFSLSGTFTNMTGEIYLYDESNHEIAYFSGTNQTINCKEYQIYNLHHITLSMKRVPDSTSVSGTIYPKFEKGSQTSTYTDYLSEGTPVTVTTCGKNLLNVPSDYSVTGSTNVIPIFLRKGTTYTISCSSLKKGGSNNPYIAFYDTDNNRTLRFDIPDNYYTFTPTKDYVALKIWSNGYDDTASAGITSVMKNLMIEHGHKQTSYESYTQTVTESTIGSEVVCKQLNDNTNIFSSNIGVSLSGQFVLSNEELFHDKLTAIIGVFADRPTDITDYDRLYIATDKTDTSRSTILPAGKSGAVLANWIYI